jgi:hypothetical protein
LEHRVREEGVSNSKLRHSLLSVVAGIALVTGLVPAMGAQVSGPPPPPVLQGAQVSSAVHVDLSPPLAEIIENQQDQQGDHENRRAKPYHKPDFGRSATPGRPSATTSAAVPATNLNFDGVGNGFSGPQGTFTVNSAPPDTNLAVGPNHVVEIVNTDFAIFNKSGSVLYGPVQINTLWSGFGGNCQADNDGDPIAKYDPIANRFVISQFAVTSPNPDYLQCVAVSQSADPTGAYYRYSFSYGNQFPDYPKMAIWPDAYYITFNMFNSTGTTFLGGQACAYDRSKMLTGAAATQQCFSLGTTYGGLLPSDLDGTRQPPSGSPNYIVADGASSNQLAYWSFHTDWANAANSTLTGPSTLATAAFTAPCGGTGGTCVPQSGTSQQLDTLGDRLMYRLAYRNFGDHEALVINRSVTAGSSTGIRWYELRTGSSNSLNIFQQGTYAPDSNYRWMGSIAQDASGDIGLGYSVSSSSLHPQIRYTGRFAGDPAGTMPQSEGTIIAGAGSQTGSNLSRWGDYSAIAVDPSDDCTFWYANEYIPANGAFNGRTRIASFKFSGCGAPPTPDFAITASPSSQSVIQGGSTSYTVTVTAQNGFTGTVNLTASGFGAGASGTLSPTSLAGSGTSTLSVTTTSNATTGSFPITITGTSGSLSHSTSVTLVVNSASGGIVNGGFETGDFTGWTRTGTTSISTSSHTGTYAAMVGSTSPTNGDSTIAQTFTAPSPTGPLTFWYQIHCPDTLTYDWALASLADNTAGTTTTLLAKTCTNAGAWVQSSAASLVGGHSYTLTLLSHDDNYPSDPTYTLFDDVALAAPPAPDFTISASPSSQPVVRGNSTSYTVTVTAQNGFTGTVNLTASGFGAGASGVFNPTSVAGSGTSTLNVTTTANAATGSFPITITGTSGSLSHGTSVTLVINPPPDFTISASPASQTVTQGNSTTYTVTITGQNGFNGTVTFGTTGFGAGASGSFSPASVAGNGTSTLTASTTSTAATGSFTINITGTSGSLSHSTTVTLVVNTPPATVIVNGGFETGNFSGWTTSGATSISATAHTGTYSANVGSSSPFNGDSSISQTFSAPNSTGHTLSFWYQVVCTDTVTYDWATATLKDNTTNTTTTVLAKTCTNNGTWAQKSVTLTGGHSYTLTLIDHDDNYANPPDPTYTLYDDVSVS